MTVLRHLAIAVALVLLGLPATPAEKLIPNSGVAFAPLPTDEPVRSPVPLVVPDPVAEPEPPKEPETPPKTPR